MIYDEFLKGTNSRDNEQNRAVFAALEKVYMTFDNITKEQIYKAGRQLVDNSKTAAEIEFEREIDAKVKVLEFDLINVNSNYTQYTAFAESSTEKGEKDYWLNAAKWEKERARRIKAEIREIKAMFN